MFLTLHPLKEQALLVHIKHINSIKPTLVEKSDGSLQRCSVLALSFRMNTLLITEPIEQIRSMIMGASSHFIEATDSEGQAVIINSQQVTYILEQKSTNKFMRQISWHSECHFSDDHPSILLTTPLHQLQPFFSADTLLLSTPYGAQLLVQMRFIRWMVYCPIMDMQGRIIHGSRLAFLQQGHEIFVESPIDELLASTPLAFIRVTVFYLGDKTTEERCVNPRQITTITSQRHLLPHGDDIVWLTTLAFAGSGESLHVSETLLYFTNLMAGDFPFFRSLLNLHTQRTLLINTHHIESIMPLKQAQENAEGQYSLAFYNTVILAFGGGLTIWSDRDHADLQAHFELAQTAPLLHVTTLPHISPPSLINRSLVVVVFATQSEQTGTQVVLLSSPDPLSLLESLSNFHTLLKMVDNEAMIDEKRKNDE